MNSWFQHSDDVLTSWIHHRWHTQGLIDFALGRMSEFSFVLDTHAVPHAEVDSDHRLMILKLRAAPGRYTSQPEPSAGLRRPPRLQVSALTAPATRDAFVTEVARQVNAAYTDPTFPQLSQSSTL